MKEEIKKDKSRCFVGFNFSDRWWIEKITKKRTSEDLELKLNYIGFGIMILLFVFITFNDIIRFVVK